MVTLGFNAFAQHDAAVAIGGSRVMLFCHLFLAKGVADIR
jgi:hypothetical protein